jgi:hypothetical protein
VLALATTLHTAKTMTRPKRDVGKFIRYMEKA